MPPAPVPTPPAAPDRRFPWKLAIAAVAVILLAWGAWAIWGRVNESKAAERWDAIARIQMDRESRDPRDWLRPARPGDAGLRREHAQRLEEQLAKNESDAEIAPYLHFQIANLLRTQILSLGDSGTFDVRRPLYDKALEHVRAIREKYPDWPLNREQFKPPNHRSLTEMLLERLTEDRAWDEQHTLRPAQPDADVVVLLRTTAGDVRLNPFLTEAPKRAKAFLDRACEGGLDGTAIFASRGESLSLPEALEREARGETWLRAGDSRTRGKARTATDKERAEWGGASELPALLPEPARWHVQHVAGVVTSWHEEFEEDEEDAEQFLFVVRESPDLDAHHTPFAKVVEPASLETLKRILGSPTFRREKPEIASDPERARLADQLVKPVVILKALVYEKGVLKECKHGEGVTVRDSEKSLQSLVPDEDKEIPPPPPPAPPAPPPPMGDAPMGDAPMDDAAMGEGAMDDTGMGADAPPAPPAPPAPMDDAGMGSASR